mgnify:CR=1 FL=1
MFNLSALIRMINTNNDQYIQKDEIKNFVEKQKSPSVFNEYFASIGSDINISEFSEQMYQIADKAKADTGNSPDIKFKSNADKKEYEKCSLEVIKEINDIKDECYGAYGYKTSNKADFDRIFIKLLKESAKEGNIQRVYEKFEKLEMKQPVSVDYIKDTRRYDVQLPTGVILSADIDWSNSREVFNFLSFDDKNFSNTPKEHLPEGYDPKQVFENGKTSGLGIDEAHANGHTGEGVSYAIIDSGTLDYKGNQHNDIKFKEYNVSKYAAGEVNHYHGRAVSYIAQEIAPQADLYYYATNNGGEMDAPVLDNLKQILEKNKSLPDDKKIRFVSMSMPLYGGEEAKKVVAELEEQGVWVFYSGDCKDKKKIGYLGKKDPMENPNDFDNYQIEKGSGIEIMPDGTVNTIIRENLLYINSGDRTLPDPSSPTAYRHDSRASQSWSIPVVAGYYTLACQADPSMTKDKFMRLAEETAQVKTSTIPISKCVGDPDNEDDWVPDGRSEQTTNIKIIDINALLKAIEAEKEQKAE